jgi:hypothetical protein
VGQAPGAMGSSSPAGLMTSPTACLAEMSDGRFGKTVTRQLLGSMNDSPSCSARRAGRVVR